MTETTFEYVLGERFGRPYLLSVRARPSTNEPEEFAVTVHREHLVPLGGEQRSEFVGVDGSPVGPFGEYRA